MNEAMKDFSIRAYAGGWFHESGYGAHSRAFFCALNQHIPVRVIPDSKGHMELTQEQLDLLNTPEKENKINIILQTVDHPVYYQNHSGPVIAFPVWESTKYPERFFQRLLDFDLLWVPTKWARDCAIAQGYPSERVFVVHEGVDGDYFKPGQYQNNGRFQFLHFGRWDYRKSTNEIIRSFIEEFDGEDTELVIGVDSSFPIDGEVLRTEDRLKKYNLLHPQIKVVHFLPRSDYLAYLQTGNCLVTCARSEGWNLSLIEGQACGIPVICSDYGAQLEFADKVAHKVKIKGLVPTKNILYQPDGIGEWAEPDFDHLKHVMRDVYENYLVYKTRAVANAAYIRSEFSWDKAANQAVQILHNSEKTFLARPKDDKPKDDRINITFNDTARVEIQGESSVTYRVVFIDQDTSLVVHEGNITPVVGQTAWISPNRRFFTNWLVQIYHGQDFLFEKKFDPTGKKVYIGLDSKSLGDTIAWIPYAEEFRKKWNCEVIVSTFWNNLLEEMYPTLQFVAPGAKVENPYASYYVGVRDNDYNSNKNNWKTIPLQKVATDYLGLDYQEIRPKVKKFSLKKLQAIPQEIPKPYVAISEFSTAQAKFWNFPGGWQTIVNYLKKQGYLVVSVSKEACRLNDVIKKNGRPIEETIANIAGADFFIGIGSGLSWLAWALDVPVILISGFSEPWCEFKECVRIANKVGCHGCFNDKDILFDRGNWAWCPRSKNFECTLNITPEQVIEGIEAIKVGVKREVYNFRQPPTGRTGLLKALSLLPPNPTILEAGMTRQEGNWKGDGYSTPIFAYHVENHGGLFYSIDIDPEAIKVSKRIMFYYGIEGKNTFLICADVISFLRNFCIQNINLLYLDAWDYTGDNGTKSESMIKHLALFQLIEPYLAEEALVVVDDIFQTDTLEGKGKLVIPYMIDLGYEVVERGYQFILRRPASAKINNFEAERVKLGLTKINLVEITGA